MACSGLESIRDRIEGRGATRCPTPIGDGGRSRYPDATRAEEIEKPFEKHAEIARFGTEGSVVQIHCAKVYPFQARDIERLCTTLNWELRERLHEAESLVFRTCSRMKKIGELKIVGRNERGMKWALSTWREPAPVRTFNRSYVTTNPKKPTETGSSWWLSPMSRADFRATAAKRSLGV